MDKKKLVFALVIIVACLVVSIVIIYQTMLPTGQNLQSEESPKEWRTITTFNGVSDKTTSVFYVTSNTWRIEWDCNGNEFAVFSFFVYPEGETVVYVESVMCSQPSGSDTTYIYEGQSGFYVKVIAANLDQWSLTIKEYS